MTLTPKRAAGDLPDPEIIKRILSGEKNLYEIIIRRYNQRLYRIGRSIMKEESEIEDIMQEAYVKAYEQMHRFEERAAFSTWLTRILINEALQRLRKKGRIVSMEYNSNEENEQESNHYQIASDMQNPAEYTQNEELKNILEKALEVLPEKYRAVFLMRETEGMSVEETSECLQISESNVKVRLNRAKEMLRENLMSFYAKADLFQFNLTRCDRVVLNVFARI